MHESNPGILIFCIFLLYYTSNNLRYHWNNFYFCFIENILLSFINKKIIFVWLFILRARREKNLDMTPYWAPVSILAIHKNSYYLDTLSHRYKNNFSSYKIYGAHTKSHGSSAIKNSRVQPSIYIIILCFHFAWV